MTDVIKEEVEAVAEVWDHGRGPKRIQAAWAGRGDSKQIRQDNQKIRNREEDKKMRADNAAMKKDEKKKMGEEVEQLVEGPSHLEYTGRVGKKEYAVRIPANKDLGDYNDSTLHNKITKANPHLAHHEVSAIVNSGGQDSREKVEHEGKTYEHDVVNHEEPRHVYSEEVEQVAEVLTKSMGAGKWIKDFVKSKNPKFAGKSEEKRKEMALGAFYSKEEVEQVVVEATNIKNVSGLKKVSSHGDFDLHKKGDDHLLVHRETGEVHHGFSGKTLDVKKFLKNYEFENLPRPAKEEVETVDEVTMRRTIPTKQERAAANKYYANHNIALSAEKRRAGIGNYPGREDPIIGNLKGAFKKNLEKDKAANEEVSLDEGRGRPPKPGSAAYKRRQSEGGGDSDTPGLHGQLIKHKSLQNAPPKIKFTNGEEAHISAEHRDRAIKHLEGMIGPGKNSQARDNAVKAMSKSHAGLKQAIGVESKPEETKSPMSAQRDKPKLSLTKEESKMAQEDIVEKLQAALDAGILSQNDFDKLTQTEEVEAVDEKALSPKQKKIAAVAGDPGKIDAEDFKKLRKEETTAGVAAVAAALSRNLKELK